MGTTSTTLPQWLDTIIHCTECTELETNRTITETSAVTEMTLRDLHPYYTYNCSVAAVTVREGPFSDSIITKTLEDSMLIV